MWESVFYILHSIFCILHSMRSFVVSLCELSIILCALVVKNIEQGIIYQEREGRNIQMGVLPLLHPPNNFFPMLMTPFFHCDKNFT